MTLAMALTQTSLEELIVLIALLFRGYPQERYMQIRGEREWMEKTGR